MSRSLLCCALLLFVAASSQADSVPIANSTFASPGAAFGPTWDVTPDQWTLSKTPLNGDFADWMTRSGMANYGDSNSQLAMLQAWNGQSQLAQTLSTNVQPNTTYTFSLAAGPLRGYDPGHGTYTFEVLAGSTPLITLTGDVGALATMWYNEVSFGAWGTALTGTATTGASASGQLSVVMRLSEEHIGGAQVCAANLVLTAVPAPEPATLSLLGVSGLLLARKRR